MNRLELTWIGKYDPENKINPEPRILLENVEYSYSTVPQGQMVLGENKATSDNMLIHGDNLLALKSLQQDFAGKVKCVYIDPPYNTGSAFEHYDDNLEHSTWLSLMKPRLELLRQLLADDGSIYVQIDNAEQAYLKVLMDEVFGRKNFVQMISVKRASPAGFKVINPGPLTVTEYILLYAKNKDKFYYNPQRIAVGYDSNYNLYIKNPNEAPRNWVLKKLTDLLYERWGISTWQEAKEKFGSSWKVVRDTALGDLALELKDCVVSVRDPHKPSDLIKKTMQQSKKQRDKIFVIPRENYSPIYIYNGGSLSFYRDKLREIDGTLTPTELLTDFWADMNYAGIANEGGLQFKNSKKPEMLVKRVLELATNPGDIVLDSFLGSGTTAAVAHKMNRRWIGIELGEHAYTHCFPRLKAVVDGEQGGISKAVSWQGGGGFRFYELAPSLLQKDKFGNLIISKEYDPEMLAQAMAKHEGYTYSPDENVVWKQGFSGDKNYIFTTTGGVTPEYLDYIGTELPTDEYLLICAKTFDKGCIGRYKNITIQQIPKMLLGRCEFGNEGYSLNVQHSTDTEDGDNDEE